MITIFAEMVLGHFVGDFLAQPRWMALGKSQAGWRGAVTCLLHVIIYTLCVLWFSGLWDFWIAVAIAVPHYIIDRRSMALAHMEMMGHDTKKEAKYPENVVRVIQYVVVDTTIHLLFLYGLLKMLG